MTHEEVREALTGAIRAIQEASGRSCSELSGETRPIADLDGFDSLNSVEAGAVASAVLGVELPDNPLASSNGTALSIHEAAAGILAKFKEHKTP